jgi:hypothetical protein
MNCCWCCWCCTVVTAGFVITAFCTGFESIDSHYYISPVGMLLLLLLLLLLFMWLLLLVMRAE